MKIYTKSGDKGTTSLYGGKRVKKYHPRIESYGTIDELNSVIGLLASSITDPELLELLHEIQNRLFTIGANLATPNESSLSPPDLKEEDVEILEKAIDRFETKLPVLKSFVLPGGNLQASQAHLARTVCRRAERRIVEMADEEQVEPIIVKYINRLSDFFFVLARKLVIDNGNDEIPWKPRK